MNLKYTCFIILILGRCFAESGIQEFINIFAEQNHDVEFIFIGIRSPEFDQSKLTHTSINSTTYFNSTSLNLNAPTIFIVTPASFGNCLEFLENISTFYFELSLSLYLWKPMFFIVWPHNIKDDTGLQNASNSLMLTPKESTHNIRLDTDVFIILEQRTKEILIAELYYLQGHRIQEIKLRNVERIVLSNYLPRAVRRQNFKRVNILAVGLGDADYEYQCKLDESNGTVRFVSGIAVDILHALQYALNFSYTAIKGEGWIEQLENGTWTGMARQIRSGEADLGISQSTFISYRFRGLGFLHATSFGHVKAFFRQPPNSSLRDIFISPFNIDLWICLLISWVMLISCMISSNWIRLKYAEEIAERQDQNMADECFLWTVSTLCQQGWYACPSALSMKIVLLCGTVLGLVYYVAFSAALVSTLSVDIVPIQSIKDLVHSDLEIWGDFWMPNKEVLVKSILDQRKSAVKRPEFLEIDPAIHKLTQKPAAYLTFADGFLTVFNRLNYSDRYYCDTFSALGVMKAPHVSGMIVLKNSPYKEVFNHKILMMRERGLASRYNRHYGWGTLAMCPKKNRQLHEQIGILDVFTAYLVLIGGISLSSVCLLLESMKFMTEFMEFSKISFRRLAITFRHCRNKNSGSTKVDAARG